MNDAELLAIIAQAERECWTELDLSGNDLERLPSEIGRLQSLEKLILGWYDKEEEKAKGNSLTTLPKEFFRLTNLKELYVAFNQISVIPDEISRLSNLEVLSFFSNQISIIPDAICQLTQLKELYLSSNRISMIPEVISNLTRLQTLTLSDNQISTVPDAISQLTNLQTLYIWNNKISVISDAICKLSNLQSLAIYSNQISIIPDALSNLSNLQSLALHNNQISVIPEAIDKLTKLKELYIYSNQVRVIPETIGGLKNLEELALEGNRISMITKGLTQLTNLQILRLSNNQISVIPNEIANLANLTRLDLSVNKITAIPDEIANLTNLTTLDLGDNQITAIPDAISNLANLTTLSLDSNQITTIPDAISNLANLTEIYLFSNQITTIPDVISNLANLTTLSLGDNQITAIPDSIANLANLTTLYLSSNQITTIPDVIASSANLTRIDLDNNQITQIPDVIAQLDKLQTLDLRNNLLPIPPEIVNDYKNSKAIFDFWLERERQPLNEAKVILVGQGTVGKTSLVKRLLDNQFDADERKTDGINIRDWQITAKNEQVKLRVWDFGGQEIMHATHQFFLTERSLYLLVINNREDELANRIEYWLKLIESLGNQAPVIIVGNKVDDHPLDLDRHGLQTKYPNIKGFIGTSCATGLGISELKQKITEIIANEMPHVFDPIPVKWLNLKDKLEQEDRDYITYQEYEQKCIETGITRESSRHTLVRLLHELGIVLNFTDDKRLKDTNVLNPEWVTVGAYRVINDNLLMTEHKGVLHWQDSARIFQPKSRKDRDDYPTEESRKFILRMMEKFELCFPMEDHNHQDYPDYLIPDLLPKEEPDTGEWKDCLNFEYHYDKVLPNSVISRFIVKSHDLIARTNYRTYWRTGVILANKEGNKAYVKADLEDAKIFIHISGNSPTRRSFLSIIRHTFDQIHDRPKLTPDERVCLPDKPKESVSYDHLLKLENRGKTEYCNSDRDYNIRELLDGIEDRRSRNEKEDHRGDTYIFEGQTGQVVIGELKTKGKNTGVQNNNLSQKVVPETSPQNQAKDATKPMKTILMLAANPQNSVSLRLQQEERDIKERLRLAGYGTEPIKTAVAVRPRDIQQAMLDFKPQIIHFSGHGADEDGLVFEDIDGQFKLIGGEDLADLFDLFSDRIECVVLNACYSETQAEAIRQNIKYVIGMNQTIGDRAAIEFAVGFYAAIGAGESYEFAFKLGCNTIRLAGIKEYTTPQLLKK